MSLVFRNVTSKGKYRPRNKFIFVISLHKGQWWSSFHAIAFGLIMSEIPFTFEWDPWLRFWIIQWTHYGPKYTENGFFGLVSKWIKACFEVFSCFDDVCYDSFSFFVLLHHEKVEKLLTLLSTAVRSVENVFRTTYSAPFNSNDFSTRTILLYWIDRRRNIRYIWNEFH